LATTGASIRVRRSNSSLVVLGGVGELCGVLPLDTPFATREELIAAASQLGWEFEAEMPVGGPDLDEVIYLFGTEQDNTAES
jgi:hypothetical protein